MSFPPLECLLHIRDEVAYLQRCRAKHSLREIAHDETLSRAVVRSLEIIGEGHQKPAGRVAGTVSNCTLETNCPDARPAHSPLLRH